MLSSVSRHHLKGLLIVALGLALAVGLVSALVIGSQQQKQQEAAAARAAFPAFPEVDTRSLSTTQQKIVALLRQEYEAQPDGTKYTEGRDEYWCADFASWIMREADVPLRTTGGHWRIDDILPLLDYYKTEGRFRAIDSGYKPNVGDTVMYQHPSPMGNHVNIVIKIDGDVLTTVGGNEGDVIRIQQYRTFEDQNALGFGVL